MQKRIKHDRLNESIQSILDEYYEGVNKQIAVLTVSSIQKLVELSKKDVPVRHGKLKSSITYKVEKTGYANISGIWYVKAPHYRITHLVQNGHALRNGGRSKATDFIGKNSKDVQEEYIKKAEEILKNVK